MHSSSGIWMSPARPNTRWWNTPVDAPFRPRQGFSAFPLTPPPPPGAFSSLEAGGSLPSVLLPSFKMSPEWGPSTTRRASEKGPSPTPCDLEAVGDRTLDADADMDEDKGEKSLDDLLRSMGGPPATAPSPSSSVEKGPHALMGVVRTGTCVGAGAVAVAKAVSINTVGTRTGECKKE